MIINSDNYDTTLYCLSKEQSSGPRVQVHRVLNTDVYRSAPAFSFIDQLTDQLVLEEGST